VEVWIVKRFFEKLRKSVRHFRSNSDLEDEMRVHVEMETEDHRAAGLTEQDARRLARLRTGNTQVAIERVRDGEWITVFEGWYRDLLFGLRALRKSPVFATTAILTLALGIGVNVAIFNFLYGLVLRDLPTHAPSQLVQLGFGSTADASGPGLTFLPYRTFDSIQHEMSSFSGMSGWIPWNITMQEGGSALRQHVAGLVTGNAFEIVPMRPYMGRLLAPFDDVRGASAQGWSAVLSYGLWSDQYGQDPHIVGKQIRVSGALATVIGVAPPNFTGIWPGMDVQIYLPMHFVNVLENKDVLHDPNSLFGPQVIGRLRPGVSISTANAELARLKESLLARFIPAKYLHLPYFVGVYTKVTSARRGLPTYITHVYAKPLYLMQGLVGLVLLLCCVNVGGLMMSRIYSRKREFAVRTALGARTWRLVRQYLTESFVIALAGSALGAVLAWRGCEIMLQFFRDPMMGSAMSIRPDGSMLYAAASLAVLTTLLLGAVPAWRAGLSDPGELLKSRTGLGGKRQVAGRAFVPVQIALSLVLVVLASLLSQSVWKLRSEKTGFDIDHVTIQNAPLSLLNLKGEAMLNLYDRLIDKLDEMPGVHAASATSKTSMTGEDVMSRFQPVGSDALQMDNVALAFDDVAPGYFETMKIDIVSGRAFTKEERRLNVCVLNQSAARYLFPRAPALGQYVKARDEKQFPIGTTCRVIGIAADAKFSDVRQGPPRTIYFPASIERFDRHIGQMVFLINSDSKLSAISAFRNVLAEYAPSVPLVIFVTLREQMDAALGSQELITLLSDFFGVMALLLSAMGLYGLLSSSVAQRTAEIGMRVALGADRVLVLRMILREALGMLGWGMLAGAIALVFAVHFVAAMLYKISSFDPSTLLGVAVLLTAITFTAAFVPAFRAATLNPVEALRAE
jgi:predicted permease